MRENGFTIIELIVVIAIMGILLAIGTLSFNKMMTKSAIESQTKILYTELMNTRVQSMFQRKGHSAIIGSYKFTSYSSNVTVAAPIVEKNLNYEVTWNGSSDGVVKFDSRGIASSLRSICVEPSDNAAGYDSIVISQTRIQMGKRNAGANCESDNIVIQ